jgi:exonuclease VII large subunit
VLQITAAENRLQALNPKAVLERGYSLTTNQRTGKVITAAADVAAGDVITTELARQERIESTVDKVITSPERE